MLGNQTVLEMISLNLMKGCYVQQCADDWGRTVQ